MNKYVVIILLTIGLIANTSCINVSSLKQNNPELSKLQNNLDAVKQRQYPETNEGKKQREQDRIDALHEYIQATQPKIKPTDPDVFYYELISKGKDENNFYFKSIFFGKDETGKDCYRQIIDHEENPEFGKVKLILFNQAARYNPWSKDSLETLGTYSDIKLRDRFLKRASKSKGGGVWCPLKNTLVAGTNNTEICNTNLEQDYIILEKRNT